MRHGTFPGTLEQLAVVVKARFDDIVQWVLLSAET